MGKPEPSPKAVLDPTANPSTTFWYTGNSRACGSASSNTAVRTSGAAFANTIGRNLLPRYKPHQPVPSEYVDRTVRSLFHFADPPVAAFEQLLFGYHFVAVEHQSYEVPRGHCADEQIPLPRWEQVARVEHHPRRRD